MTLDEASRRIRAHGWHIRTCDDLAQAIRRVLDEERRALKQAGKRLEG